MTDRQRDLMSLILDRNMRFHTLPHKERMEYLFSSSSNKAYKDKLGIKGPNLSNLFQQLSKKTYNGYPLISKDKILNPALDIAELPDMVIFEFYDQGTGTDNTKSSEEIRSGGESSDGDVGSSDEFPTQLFEEEAEWGDQDTIPGEIRPSI